MCASAPIPVRLSLIDPCGVWDIQISYFMSPASPNVGKSRVPWLTGTASWSYFVALQHILGIQPGMDALRIDPCIPPEWPGFEVKRNWRGYNLEIRVQNSKRIGHGVKRVKVGSQVIQGNAVPLASLFDGAVISVELEGR